MVAPSGAGFAVTYGADPDFEIRGTSPGAPDRVSVRMSGTAGLTHAGEAIAQGRGPRPAGSRRRAQRSTTSLSERSAAAVLRRAK